MQSACAFKFTFSNPLKKLDCKTTPQMKVPLVKSAGVSKAKSVHASPRIDLEKAITSAPTFQVTPHQETPPSKEEEEEEDDDEISDEVKLARIEIIFDLINSSRELYDEPQNEKEVVGEVSDCLFENFFRPVANLLDNENVQHMKELASSLFEIAEEECDLGQTVSLFMKKIRSLPKELLQHSYFKPAESPK
jgi:hypothetical protein